MHGPETTVGGMTDMFTQFTGKKNEKRNLNLEIEYAISQL